jgi:hypothetical protein
MGSLLSRALAQAQAEGKTVMVDFTAEWCLTCKVNLATAINTRKVQEVVEPTTWLRYWPIGRTVARKSRTRWPNWMPIRSPCWQFIPPSVRRNPSCSGTW